MLSLGRKYVSEGLGFGVGGQMEETEREEGEAYFQDEVDAQLSSLSYIEGRLQDVLGHFQKDFEGEVSAENLGAKFGGYGSFLPTYQRSPAILSQPRTPPKAQSHNPPRSPNNPPSEDTYQDLKIPPNPSHSRSARTESAPFYAENSSKRDMHLSTAQAAEDPISTHASMNKSLSATDQKSLKVRIKIGSDNVSARKNAAIYSGLGLDISPSSSFEDSPVGSGVSSPDYGVAPHESPLSILQVMSSPFVSGAYLLSPLAENLMLLTEKPCMKDSKPWNVQKGNQASPPMLTNEHVPVMDVEMFGETKMKFIDKVRQPMEARNANRKSVGNDMSNLLEKGNEAETLVDGELFPKASKSPLPSHSKSSVERVDKQIDSGKERGNDRASGLTKELNKGMVKDVTLSSDLVKGETSDNGGNELVPFNGHPNSKKHSVDTARKDKTASSYKDVLFDTVKDDESKGDKRINNLKDDSDEIKGMTGQNSGSVEPPKQKASQKAVLYEKDEGKMPKEKESKKKSKSNQSNSVRPTEFPQKESAAVVSLATSKDKKKSSKDRDPCSVNKNYVTKPHDSSMTNSKELGGIATEQDDKRMVTLEMHLKDNLNDLKLKIEGEAHVSAEKYKEKLCGKKVESLTISKEAKTQDAMPLTGNGLTSDAVAAPVDPFLIKENWVACDRCQKWRLLPFGMNPDHLPKKWLCSMLTWLPGMNKCTISEEETTNALYQVPVSQSQHNLQSQCSAAGSGVTLADAQHLDQSHELSSHALPSGGKRKHGSKDPSNSLCHSTQNSIEKNQQVCTKKLSVNDVNQLPVESHMVGKVAYQHLSKSNDIAVENHRHRQKDKHKLLERSSDGGNHIEQSSKHSKSKSKRADNQDHFRTTKKIKAEDFNYTEDGAWHSSQDVIEKVVPNLAGSLLTKSSVKKKQKHNNYISSEEFKGETRDKLPESRKKLKGQVQVPLDGEYKTQIGSSDFAMKKRKVKERQEHRVYLKNLPFSGHVSDNIDSVKEICETELRKKKKARLSKPEGKEYSASMKDSKLDKKSNVVRNILPGAGNKDPPGDGMGRVGSMNNHQLGQHEVSAVNQQAMDGDDSLKRDLGCGQPSTAATSSSSKVSGSHKSKLNFQVKSSPVESVSSSPLKICSTDNLTTARSNVLGKNDGANVGFFVMGSPRQGLDFEGDDLIDRSGMARKEKSSSIVQHASVKSQKVEESSVPYQGRGANRISSGEAKDGMISKAYDGMCSDPLYSEYGNVNVVTGSASTSDQHNPYLGKVHDHEHDSEKSNNRYSTNGSSMQKSGKSSSRSRERRKNAKTDLEKVKVKVSECFSEQEELYPMTNDGSNRYGAGIEPRDFSPYHEDLRDEKYDNCKKSVVEFDKDEKCYIGRKDLMADLFGDVKMDGDSKIGILETSDYPLLNKQHTGPSSKGGKSGIDYSKDGKSSLLRKPRQVTYDEEKSMNRLLSESADPAEMASDEGKLLPNGASSDKQEIQTRHPHSMPMLRKNSRADVLPVDASSSDAVKEKKQPRKPNSQNVVRNSSRHSTPNAGSVGRDLNAPSPVKKDSGQAAAMLREAKDLKHTADRLVNGGLELDRTGLYFQAALKFLHGASLLEPCNFESAKHGETTQSMKVYIDTAKLCQFCAREYEKCKEMAAAALAYKCMEVAHMRVIYSKQYIVGKDRHELQSLLQVAPLGESPPSSVSDIDNLNNQATLEKAGLAKGTNSSQAAGNLVITPRNRPSMQRLLHYVNHMDSAIEALKKSRNALAAANASAEARYGTEGISSVRRVLEFNFHDVESLLRLVRLALEAINT